MTRPLRTALFFVLAVTAARASATPTLPAPGTYVVASEGGGSKVVFSITEMLVNTVHGSFHSFSGKVVVGDSLASTRIEAAVDIASVDTNTHKRDEHLRTAEWLDAQQFPKMTFVSTSIAGTAANITIKGNLTLKGVTKEVTLWARILDDGTISAEGLINRTEFGITTGKVVKDDVHLHLLIRMTKA